MTTDTKRGRSAERIVEGGAGGLYHRALAIFELDNALYAAGEEFRYDETEPANGLVQLVDALRAHVATLSLTDDAELTLDRACDACGGNGLHWDHQGDPCPDCKGTGVEVRGESRFEASAPVPPPANSPQTQEDR